MHFTRRHLLATSALAGDAATLPGIELAQVRKPAAFRLKLGTDLPVTPSENLDLEKAIAASTSALCALLAGLALVAAVPWISTGFL